MKLEPAWKALMSTVNQEAAHKITVARVDCTQNGDLCNEEKIQGYPTLKLYRAEDTTGVEYEGPRNLLALVEFLNKQLETDIKSEEVRAAEKILLAQAGDEDLGAEANEEELDEDVIGNEDVGVPDAVNGLFELTDENAVDFLATGRHFVKFYAPW